MDHRYCAFSGPVLVVHDIMVLCYLRDRELFHDSSFGRNPCLESYLLVFKQCGQRYRLEDRSRFCRASCCHVEGFDVIPEAVLLQVYHCSDRSGLHVHDDHASFLDDRIGSHVRSQSLVCDVLHVDVKGCHDVRSVLSGYICAVLVLDAFRFVGFLFPCHSLCSVEVIVVFAFDSDMDGTCVIVVLNISDHSPCKSPVRI